MAEVNFRDLPAVRKNVTRPERGLAQTFLKLTDRCPRAGFLYLDSRHGPTSIEMDRGTAVHDVLARLIRLMVERTERTVPREVAKEMANAVILERTDLDLSLKEQEIIRICAFHFAEGFAIDPEHVVAIEKLYEVEVGGVNVRCRVDFAQFWPDTGHLQIVDWKSAAYAPPEEEVREDFQLNSYALAVRDGKGVDEPFGLSGVETIDVMQAYPRYLTPSGMLIRGPFEVEQHKPPDIRVAVQRVINVAQRGFDEGKWQAVSGSHCSECPMPNRCPLPPALVPVAHRIRGNTETDAEAMAEVHFHFERIAKAAHAALKGTAKEHGAVRFGADQLWEWNLEEKRTKQPVEGEPFDPERHVKLSRSTTFRRRTLKQHELDREGEGT